ncbi:transcriptional regulator, TetR family [Albimonas donghaensis]|uniref:Transcriptional regulator, TetR family n=1 Tax=Albimonas donghaensis TaxID=356660 RepID=A0A1H3ALM8_9RHOB|nr:TetR/AcrR family transcriptional regulator [Albimonas donghaensis]SDX30586.1 transcriptional regulator, TetR family [Albimonas donghaensis]
MSDAGEERGNGRGGEEGGRARRGYHHGNLREALVEAALPLIAERGPQGFTLAEVAREAGVSGAAPYRHFKGREDLIAEMARRGFDLFADLLERAWNGGEPSPISAFEKMSRAYLHFARAEPGMYIAMFESGVTVGADPALLAASDRAMEVMRRASEALVMRLPPEKRPPVQMMSYHIWALSHGVVELFARDSAGRKASISAEDLLESGAMVYLRGLGLIPGAD